LTPVQRLRIGRLVVDDGWPIVRAADFFHVSWPTAKRWADRYRAQVAASDDAVVRQDAMTDRSSRPRRMPTKTPQRLVRKIVHVRCRQRLGPVQIAGQLNLPASTVHKHRTTPHRPVWGRSIDLAD